MLRIGPAPVNGAESPTPAYLAFDLGASSGRAILGRLEGERITMREVHRFTTPLVERDGHLYWDLEALWREVREGLERGVREEPGVRSLSVDSWAVDYVPLDEEGTALRDAYAYRDPRTRGRMAEAFESVSADELYRRTGIQLLEINTVYQLLADRAEEPERLRATAVRLLIADYLLFRLCGRAAVERTNASTTQLMDVSSGEWAFDLIERLGLPRTGWPEIVPPGTVLGRLARSPRGGAAPLVVAGCSHDTGAAVAAVPAPANGPAWAYLSSGTWSLLGVERSAPILSEAAREANFTNEAGLDDTFRILKNLTGLWVLQECERGWREAGDAADPATLADEAAAASAAAPVDLNDPRFSERGAMEDRLRSACRELGVPEPRTRGEIVRLVLESLAAGYARALSELERVIGERIEVLHVVGGGSRNELLCQLTADACGRRVVAGPAEATALGNLLVQARALGDLPGGRTIRDVVRASVELREYEPGNGGRGGSPFSNPPDTPTARIS